MSRSVSTVQTTHEPTVIVKLKNRPFQQDEGVPPTKQQQKPQQPKPKKEKRITWTEDTIDNEGLGRLKSNLCCIYHKPGSSSSDTCTSDDGGNALERDRQTKAKHREVCSKRKPKKCNHNHSHQHAH